MPSNLGKVTLDRAARSCAEDGDGLLGIGLQELYESRGSRIKILQEKIGPRKKSLPRPNKNPMRVKDNMNN